MRPRSIREIRAARALLDWSLERLASEAGVPQLSVERLEADESTPADLEETGEKARAALRAAGVVFLDGDEPGVRLRRTGPPNEGTRVQDLTSDNDD